MSLVWFSSAYARCRTRAQCVTNESGGASSQNLVACAVRRKELISYVAMTVPSSGLQNRVFISRPVVLRKASLCTSANQLNLVHSLIFIRTSTHLPLHRTARGSTLSVIIAILRTAVILTALSAVLVAADDEVVILSFCGVDIVGHDIWNARHPGPDACVANCLPDTGATWTNYQVGTWWFKSVNKSYTDAVPGVGATSFVRMPRNTGRYMGPDFPANVDMPGNDIGTVPGSDVYDCIWPWDHNAFCFAYTWTNYRGGTCWLKSKASTFVYTPGASARFSGRVTNPDTYLAKL